jgi:thiopeptide-type bacteriocin biosynthesis protein
MPSWPVSSVSPQVRLRPPGSDWLFMKLYCPSAIQDQLIAGPVRSFGEFVRSAAMAHAWMFVRYADPDPDLRLRFHGPPDVLVTISSSHR